MFFGREELVTDLVERLHRDRFLVVAGASGAGKSSLLRAGVVHRVATDVLMGHSDWRTVVLAPGAKPLTTWTERLAAALGDVPGDVDARAALTEDPAALPRLAELAGVSLLVVVDQFEEIFAAEVADEERTAFLTAVLATRSTKRLRMVLVVRADFLGHCARHSGLVEAMRDRHVLVGPMTVSELRSAITEPAARAGCTVEAALLATLVAEAANERGGLPLVSHALLETWRRRRGRVLTLSGYEAAGGIQDAVVRTAEAVHARLSEEEAVAARVLFLRLVNASEGTERFLRRRVASAELDRENPLNAGVLDAFATARLLTVDEGAVEIAHEALISSWPRLIDWIAEDREGHRVHQRLAVAAADWDELGRDPSALYRGTRLAVAREWAAREKDFLDAAVAAEKTELGLQARRTRQLRQLVAGLAVALVVAVFAGLIVPKQRQDAIDLQQLALSRQLAAAHDDSVTVWDMRDRRALVTIPGVPGSIALSPDGRRLARHGEDGFVVWNIDGTPIPSRLPVPVTENYVGLIWFSQDGTTLARIEFNVATLWDAATGAPRGRVTTGGSLINSLAFSPDGRFVATGHDTGEVLVSETAGGRLVTTLRGHRRTVDALAWRRDGPALASMSWGGEAILWDLRPERAVPTLCGLLGELGRGGLPKICRS